jgi:hypothetical protein
MATPAEFFLANRHNHRKALEMLGHPAPTESREKGGEPEPRESPAEFFTRTKDGQRKALEMLGHPPKPG